MVRSLAAVSSRLRRLAPRCRVDFGVMGLISLRSSAVLSRIVIYDGDFEPVCIQLFSSSVLLETRFLLSSSTLENKCNFRTVSNIALGVGCCGCFDIFSLRYY